MTIDAVELVGYAASALVVLSLTMSSLLRLRVISLVGSVTFAAYGALIGAPPVLVTNAAIALINIVHLRRLFRDSRGGSGRRPRQRDRAGRGYFEVVPAQPGSPLLRRFIDFHAEDITRFQPSFAGVRPDSEAWWVLREAVPAGTLLARLVDVDTVHVDLDYVIEAHRDFQPGQALFGPAGAFAGRGLRRITSEPGSPAHQRYLERMGFRAAGAVWARELPP